MSRKMADFAATIYKIGINPVVDPPDEVLDLIFKQAGRSKGPIPVCGTINGANFVQTLVRYQGAWRLYVNGPMLMAAGLSVGDVAVIEVEFDSRPRDVPVPPEFRSALARDGRAREAFDELSPSRQKEILRYLGNLRTADSLSGNVEKIVRQLSGKHVEKPHIAIRPAKKR